MHPDPALGLSEAEAGMSIPSALRPVALEERESLGSLAPERESDRLRDGTRQEHTA
jgi:hypothetical protein